MSKLWSRTHDAQGASLLHEVDLKAQPISQPTIVYISGYKTEDTLSEVITETFDFIQTALQNQPSLASMPQVYCWSHEDSRRALFNIASYGYSKKHLYCQPAEKLANQALLPLVLKDGKPLPIAEAQKNLRNLTLFGYSAGSVIAQEMYNFSHQKMVEAGYTKEDAGKLLKEIVLITIGTISSPPKEKNRFTTIALATCDDRFVRVKNAILHPLLKSFYRATRQLTIKPLSDTTLFITAANSRRMWDRRKGREKGMDVDLPPWNKNNSNHTRENYVNFDDEHSQFSRIVPYALINAVNRKSTVTPYQLLEPPAAVPALEKALYKEKIAKARARVKAPKQE